VSRLRGIEEPVTLLTDLVLGILALYWAASLLAAGADPSTAALPTVIWGAGFAATGAAAILGGVVHGFQHRMGRARARPLWHATLLLVALSSAAMLAAALLVFPASLARTGGLVVVVAKLLVASALLARTPEFRVVLADHAVALAAVLGLQLAAYLGYGAASAPWIMAGIAVSVAAGAIQALRIGPHPRFNHNDLYHVVQIGALWLLYRGGLLLGAG
jgi:hypothetical protein